jgi:hypothetical protein
MLKVYDRVLDQRMQDIENFGNNDRPDSFWSNAVKVGALLLDSDNFSEDVKPHLIIDLMADLAGWYEQMEREGRT